MWPSLSGMASSIVGSMDYESLGSILVVVIAAILIVAWMPVKTLKGMRRASEHRQDRLSTSLHLVGREDGRRFGDAGSPLVKGLVMQHKQQDSASRREAERVRRIRQLRRQAARRRSLLVLSLLLVTALVAGLSFVFRYSLLYCLIPLALAVVVLGFGVHASAQARAWEDRLARRRSAREPGGPSHVHQAHPVSGKVGQGRPDRAAAPSPRDVHREQTSDESATGVMDEGEIRKALNRSKTEQMAALKARRARQAKAVRKDEAGSDRDGRSQGAAERTRSATDPAGLAADLSASQSTSSQSQPAQTSPIGKEEASGADPVDDETYELARISPSPALDAFEMAASQDLISFSLGPASDRSSSQAEGPQSREIKSTRQVAQARPVDDGRGEEGPADTDGQRDSERAGSPDGKDRPADFHRREVEAEVEAPEGSDDSLSIGVEAILARRGATGRH